MQRHLDARRTPSVTQDRSIRMCVSSGVGQQQFLPQTDYTKSGSIFVPSPNLSTWQPMRAETPISRSLKLPFTDLT